MSNDPFAPINLDDARHKRAGGGMASDWEIRLPVPAEAPPPPDAHPSLGRPTMTWAYRDAAGTLLHYVYRFQDPANPKDKTFRGLTLHQHLKNNKQVWRWESVKEPRFLYGLDRLSAHPDKLVIVAEGEKSADAVEKLLPNCVAITSPNGSKSPSKADWKPCVGRRVVIWLDADAAGIAYAETVAEILADIGALSVQVVIPPPDVAEGWDAADALAEGWTTEQATALIMATRAPRNFRAAVASANVIDATTRIRKRRKGSPDGEGDDDGGASPRDRDRLLRLVADLELWQSPSKTYYARIIDGDFRQNLAIDSDEFRLRLYGLADTQNFMVGAQAVESVVKTLCSRASKGPRVDPWIRVGQYKGKNYIDLGNADGRNIEIANGQWEIKERSELNFIQSNILQPLPEPEGGSEHGISLMRSFFPNISENDFVLIVAWIMYSLTKREIYPIMCIHAEQNSGKSTFAKMLRSLVDPSVGESGREPKDDRDLFILASQSHVIDFDNLSGMSGRFADALCQIATGGTYSTRKLMTDGSLFMIKLSRPIIMNGIAHLTDRQDLGSRTITIRPRTFTRAQRRDSEVLTTEWEQARPEILGILLDGVAAGLVGASKITLDDPSRLAAFEKFSMAALPAVGIDPQDFERAFKQNADDSAAAAFENDIVAPAIFDFVMNEHHGSWSGTITELLTELSLRANDSIRKLHSWPKTPVSLGTKIDRVAPLLRSRGLDVHRGHTGEKRVIQFYPM